MKPTMFHTEPGPTGLQLGAPGKWPPRTPPRVKKLSLEYLGFIPCDEAIPKAVLQQQPVLILHPEAPASKSFTKIARYLLESPPSGEVDGSIKFFWRRWLGGH